MSFTLDRIENKIEFFEAYDLKTLEAKIDAKIENNKALLLDVFSICHQVVFDPNAGKMLYSAVVHFKVKN
ncbi:YrzA family protein [Paenibacillus sp. MZ04-78.2]|uniref:YrzA family protein n=1 Tax=Paenibacillus sp. MZ04-78.2 TaxID=2962034 RepID=UPI0020B71E2A|nr:YrzA family protein [Paenibacillus sp. MZ04-78.2]MCP3771746.1 YrzA family protein [Paenibacillus sp. MZ04-78.2]